MFVIACLSPKTVITHRILRWGGLPNLRTIIVSYRLNGGTKGPQHSSKEVCHHGGSRQSYFPDNEVGRKVFNLIIKDRAMRVTFRVCRLIAEVMTSERVDVITSNDVHRKTDLNVGANYGYSDPTCLDGVTYDTGFRYKVGWFRTL